MLPQRPTVPDFPTIVLLWTLPALFLALGGWLLWPSLQSWRRARRLRKSLSRLGPKIRAELVLENGIGGLAFIDYAVLTPGGIAVIDYLPCRGAIFGGVNSDQWAQVIGRRTIRFANPVARNLEHVAAVHDNFPGVPVQGFVLFGPEASFPKGSPAAVITPAYLRKLEPPGDVADGLRRSWRALDELADRNAKRFAEELAMSRGSSRWARRLAGGAVVLLALAWTAVLLAGAHH